jgi:hypothetical protein
MLECDVNRHFWTVVRKHEDGKKEECWKGQTTHTLVLRMREDDGVTHAILVESASGVLLWESAEQISSYELPFVLSQEISITADSSGKQFWVMCMYQPPRTRTTTRPAEAGNSEV